MSERLKLCTQIELRTMLIVSLQHSLRTIEYELLLHFVSFIKTMLEVLYETVQLDMKFE